MTGATLSRFSTWRFFSREQAKSDCDWMVMSSVFVASQSSCFFLCSREHIRLVENRLYSIDFREGRLCSCGYTSIVSQQNSDLQNNTIWTAFQNPVLETLQFRGSVAAGAAGAAGQFPILLLYSILKEIHLLVSQSFPVYPGAQTHLCKTSRPLPLPASSVFRLTHFPPFKQGFESHSFTPV